MKGRNKEFMKGKGNGSSVCAAVFSARWTPLPISPAEMRRIYMKDQFESDDERIFAQRLFMLCMDDAACGLPIDMAKEIRYLTLAHCLCHVFCESPIEKMLGSALIFANDGLSRLEYRISMDGRHALTSDTLRNCVSKNASMISPQVKVGKDYRVDFLVATRLEDDRVILTAIECDGHDFHERTKEQASRDKKRDRSLTVQGVSVLRFTGSDIHHRLDECVIEIQDYLAGLRFGREVAA